MSSHFVWWATVSSATLGVCWYRFHQTAYCNLFCWFNLRIWCKWPPIYLQFFKKQLDICSHNFLTKTLIGIRNHNVYYSIQHKYGVPIDWYTTRFKKSYFHHTVKWSREKAIEKFKFQKCIYKLVKLNVFLKTKTKQVITGSKTFAVYETSPLPSSTPQSASVYDFIVIL